MLVKVVKFTKLFQNIFSVIKMTLATTSKTRMLLLLTK